MTNLSLDRRESLKALGSCAVSLPLMGAGAPTPYSPGDYHRATVIDMQGGFDNAKTIEQAIQDVARSGLTAISATVGMVGNGPDRWKSVVDEIAFNEGLIDANPRVLSRIRRYSDLTAAKTSGRTGLVYNVQDTSALEGDVGRVGELKKLGVRVVQLTYNKRNLCGDGCLEPGDAGISDLGRQVIDAVNSSKLLLDLSHGGRRTISEAAQYSKAPPAVTHTACRALVNNQRNLDDDQMREIAERGGVVGIYLIAYLRSGIGQPALNARGQDLIAHIEHASRICGEDHIGIGTDGGVSALVIDAEALANQKARYEDRVKQGFATAGEGPDVFNYVPEYNSPLRFLMVAQDLAKRGWSTRAIDKLIGGNFDRLLREIWDA